MNETKYNEIRTLLGDEFEVLKEVYSRDTENRIADIASCLDKGDSGEIRQLAHAMKSSSANIGAEEVSVLAANIESYALDENISEIRLIFPSLKKAVEDTIKFMNN